MNLPFPILDLCILTGGAFFGAVLSGSIGMAGGIFLLTIMSPYFSPMILIPVHGIVQFASNITRAYVHRNWIDKKIAIAFSIGALVGGAIGSQMVVSLPDREFKIIIAIFIVIATWLPKLKNAPEVPGKFFLVGLLATWLSLFVGAVGLIIGPVFLREKLTKEGLIATQAICQSILHTCKILVFFFLGLSFHEYYGITLLLVGAVFVGTWCSKWLLHYISENIFRWIFRICTTALAIRLFLETI